jgi:hypothetical protein
MCLKSELFVSKVYILILEERMIKVKVIVIVTVIELKRILDIGWTEMNVIQFILIACLKFRVPVQR